MSLQMGLGLDAHATQGTEQGELFHVDVLDMALHVALHREAAPTRVASKSCRLKVPSSFALPWIGRILKNETEKESLFVLKEDLIKGGL